VDIAYYEFLSECELEVAWLQTREGLAAGRFRQEIADEHIVRIEAELGFDVFSRKLSPERWRQVQPALRELLLTARFVTVRFTWRPSSPDPGDEHVIDCAMNANAFLITWNVKDFRRAVEHLHLVVMTPPDYVYWVGSHLPASLE